MLYEDIMTQDVMAQEHIMVAAMVMVRILC